MGKKSKGISGSDVLDLTTEEYELAQERKTYGQTPGSGGVPDGEYVIECTDFERTVSEGEKTAGAPKFILKFRVAEGDHKGRKTPAYFATAAASTAAQVVRLFDVAGIETGKTINLKLLTEDKFVGLKMIGVISTRPAKGNYAASPQLVIKPLEGASGKGGKKGGGKKKSAIAS